MALINIMYCNEELSQFDNPDTGEMTLIPRSVKAEHGASGEPPKFSIFSNEPTDSACFCRVEGDPKPPKITWKTH